MTDCSNCSTYICPLPPYSTTDSNAIISSELVSANLIPAGFSWLNQKNPGIEPTAARGWKIACVSSGGVSGLFVGMALALALGDRYAAKYDLKEPPYIGSMCFQAFNVAYYKRESDDGADLYNLATAVANTGFALRNEKCWPVNSLLGNFVQEFSDHDCCYDSCTNTPLKYYIQPGSVKKLQVIDASNIPNFTKTIDLIKDEIISNGPIVCQGWSKGYSQAYEVYGWDTQGNFLVRDMYGSYTFPTSFFAYDHANPTAQKFYTFTLTPGVNNPTGMTTTTIVLLIVAVIVVLGILLWIFFFPRASKSKEVELTALQEEEVQLMPPGFTLPPSRRMRRNRGTASNPIVL